MPEEGSPQIKIYFRERQQTSGYKQSVLVVVFKTLFDSNFRRTSLRRRFDFTVALGHSDMLRGWVGVCMCVCVDGQSQSSFHQPEGGGVGGGVHLGCCFHSPLSCSSDEHSPLLS